jgi:hypothetical protein
MQISYNQSLAAFLTARASQTQQRDVESHPPNPTMVLTTVSNLHERNYFKIHKFY